MFSNSFELNRDCMEGTFFFESSDNHFSSGFISEIALLGFDEISRIENLISEFKSTPLKMINDYAGDRAIQVDSEVFELIKRAQKIIKEESDMFDISSALIGYHHKKEKIVKKITNFLDRDAYSLQFIYDNMVLNDEAKTVFLPKEGMKINLRGVGKNYAITNFYDIAFNSGLRNFQIKYKRIS